MGGKNGSVYVGLGVGVLISCVLRQKLLQYKAAIDACDKVLKLDSGNVKAHFRRGQGYTELTRFEEARDCFNKVISLDASNEEAKRELLKLKKAEAKVCVRA